MAWRATWAGGINGVISRLLTPEKVMMDILTLLAIALGPFLAIWAHGVIERRRLANDRRLLVFKTLWATRAIVISNEHVAALNQIDLEFTRAKDKKVRDAWTVYLDHLGDTRTMPPSPEEDAEQAEWDEYKQKNTEYEQDQKVWNDKSQNLLADMLEEMGKLFDYDFDKVRIKKAGYRPQGLASLEQYQNNVLLGVNDLLSGRKPLPMDVVNWPEQTDEQKAVLQRIISAVDDDGAYRVKIISDPEEEDLA